MRLKSSLLLGVAICYCFVANAQKPDGISGVDHFNNAIDLAESNLDDAIAELDLIHSGDTVYPIAQFQKGFYLIQQEKYDEFLALAEPVMDTWGQEENGWYLNLGTIYENQEQPEKALEIYTKGTEVYPFCADLHFARGTVLLGLDRSKEALLAFDKALECNPYLEKVHRHLAFVALQGGHDVPALMAMTMALIVGDSGEDALRTLSFMNEMCSASIDLNDTKDHGIFTARNYPFEEIELVFDNRVALQKKYKIKTDLDFPLTRQLHLIFANLDKIEKSDDIYSRRYVPFFREVMNSKNFDPFCFTLFRSSTNEKVKKDVTAHTADIKKFFGWAYGQIRDQFINVDHTIAGKKGTYEVRRYDQGEISFIGTVKNGNGVGPCEFYYDNGRLHIAGTFDNAGERTGSWTEYWENGNQMELTQYKNGKLDGEATTFNRNGTVGTILNFKEGSLHGECLYHNHRGVLTTKVVYDMSDLSDTEPITYYFSTGVVEATKHFKDNIGNGMYTAWHDNGQKRTEYNLVDNKAEGNLLEWYPNGQKEFEGVYKAGERDGLCRSWYKNGALAFEGSYVNGSAVGKHTEYHLNGKLDTESEFDESGKEHGVFKEYSWGGKLVEETELRKGEIVGYTAYNSKGEVIKSEKKSSGQFYYQGFYIDGTLQMEGAYKVGKQSKEGEWKYYDHNGILEMLVFYRDNLRDGPATEYFSNGVIDSKVDWTMDNREGYYESYYEATGTLYCDGWYKDDKQWGVWNYYYRDGTPEKTYRFLEGELNGVQEYFSVTGAKETEELYDKGILTGIRYFNADGGLREEFTIGAGDQVVIRTDEKGRKMATLTFRNHMLDGTYEYYLPNGKPWLKGAMKNGRRHGVWEWYHQNGKLKTKGAYESGKREGEWNWYHMNGKLKSTSLYLDGKQHGIDKNYFENGKMSSEWNYYMDEADGEVKFFNEDGLYEMSRIYENGKWVAYRLSNSQGQPGDIVPISNETGEITAIYPGGQKARVFAMKHGDFIGEYLKYYKSGQLLEITRYENGVISGTEDEYYSDGKLKRTTPYERGEKNGTQIEYYPDGKKEREMTYLNGYLHGDWIEYDRTGKVTKKWVFYDNDVVEEI